MEVSVMLVITLTIAIVLNINFVFSFPKEHNSTLAELCKNETISPSSKFSFHYPSVRRDPSIVDDYFGTKISDPYRWLEDPDSKETVEFVEAQNNLTLPYLQKAEGRDFIRKRLESILDHTKYGVPEMHGNKLFYSLKKGLQNQAVLYVEESKNARVLIDPNGLSVDGTVAISTGKASKNGEIYAYGLSSKGSDWVEIRFKNVSTGEDFPEVLQHTKWPGIQWTHDGVGIFYSGYPKPNGTADGSETTSNENMKLYFHRVGTDQDQDLIIAEFTEHPKWTLAAQISDDNKYLVITAIEGLENTIVFYTELEPIIKSDYKLDRPPLTQLLNDSKYYFITNNGEIFYFRTNKGAANYRIVGVYINKPDEKYWATLLPENSQDVLDWASPINNDMMVVCYIRDVKSVLEVRRLSDGSLINEVDFGVGTVGSFSGEREDTQFFFSVSSFLYPGKIFSVDLKNKAQIEPILYKESVIEGFDSSLYSTEQIFYKSKDGTKVPMFIISKKDVKLDGTAPTLLYGYGGFDISLQPSFSEARLSFIQVFNGIVAIANIRGGGEYGVKWHDGGRLLNKQNSFDDFQAAAEYLIENKYTSSNKLTIQGGSNGGLLMGACLNQRPELFGAVIAQVGVLDMLRYQKFTIGYAWATDYGTSDNETHFNNLVQYSPLHNVKVPKDDRVQYPAVLVMTGDHDDRVVPLHSYKFISELQFIVGRSSHQTNPLLILIETNAGHGAGKPTGKKVSEIVDQYSFLVQSLQYVISGDNKY